MKTSSVGTRVGTGLLLILSIGSTTRIPASDAPAIEAPWAPHLESRPVRASQLHLGMDTTEVVRIMGEGGKKSLFHDSDTLVFSFPTEPIPTKVVLEGNKVTSISLDIARFDEARLPISVSILSATRSPRSPTSGSGRSTPYQEVDRLWHPNSNS